MSKYLDKFPKYKSTITIHNTSGLSCEGYTGVEKYFEIADEYKTDENWELDIPRANVFIPTSECLPFQEIDENALNGVHIIAHTRDFLVTLDSAGVWPVLHPK